MAENEIPPEMFSRALDLCKKFVGGSWGSIGGKDLHLARVRGGTSNLLYKAQLNNTVDTEDGEPRKVLIRIYGPMIAQNTEMMIKDCVISSLMADKGFGPKVYGVFEQGHVEEYIEHRQLYAKDLQDPEISAEAARILARIHKIKMPINKEPSCLFDSIKGYIDDIMENTTFKSTDPRREELFLRIQSLDLSAEQIHLKNLLGQVPSPVVFCHNDLQEGNLLHTKSDIGERGWKLIPIDFEYCSYNYRGYDIGNHLVEWCYELNYDQPPYFLYNIKDYPNRDQQMLFLKAYLEELEGTNEDVTSKAEDMLCEVDAYRLASHFFWGLWSIVQDRDSPINFDFLEYAWARFDAYLIQKKEFLLQYRQNEH